MFSVPFLRFKDSQEAQATVDYFGLPVTVNPFGFVVTIGGRRYNHGATLALDPNAVGVLVISDPFLCFMAGQFGYLAVGSMDEARSMLPKQKTHAPVSPVANTAQAASTRDLYFQSQGEGGAVVVTQTNHSNQSGAPRFRSPFRNSR